MPKSRYRMGKPKKILYEKLQAIEQKLDALSMPQDFRIQKEDLEQEADYWIPSKSTPVELEEDDTIGMIMMGVVLLVLMVIAITSLVKVVFF